MNIILDHHTNIAIDFDNTLVNHKNSSHIMNYVYMNHKNKKFIIITFRNNHHVKIINEELMYYSHNLLDESFFDQIINIDDHYLNAISDNSKLLAGDDFMKWKGKMCYENNCTLLIDDIKSWTLPGCIEYGIEYMHPDNFILSE